MKTKKQILIVEDEQDTLQFLLRAVVSRRNDYYDIHLAMDGFEALRTLKSMPIDCVLLDLHMSNCNGLEVIEDLVAQGRLRSTEIIISSGFVDESMELQLQSFGVKHILRKPYTSRQLIAKLDELLQGSAFSSYSI